MIRFERSEVGFPVPPPVKGRDMSLEKELATYRLKLAELRDNEGKFALVHGDEVDVFTAYEDAIKEGYKRYGLEPFMVKRIEAAEHVHTITRLIEPECPTSH